MKKGPSSIWCQDLNPQPLERESPPITTRSGLPPIQSICSMSRCRLVPVVHKQIVNCLISESSKYSTLKCAHDINFSYLTNCLKVLLLLLLKSSMAECSRRLLVGNALAFFQWNGGQRILIFRLSTISKKCLWGSSPGLVVMGGETHVLKVVGLNPSTVYWMVIFHIYLM